MTPTEFENAIRDNKDKLQRQSLKYFPSDKANRDDLIQDTLISAFRALESFDGSYFFAWLSTIMKNKFIDHTRRVKKSAVDIDTVDASVAITEINFLDKGIHMDVKMLPPRYRYPLMLFIDGYEYEKIGEILKMPRNSVGANISHGRDLLRAKRDFMNSVEIGHANKITNDTHFEKRIKEIKRIANLIDKKSNI